MGHWRFSNRNHDQEVSGWRGHGHNMRSPTTTDGSWLEINAGDDFEAMIPARHFLLARLHISLYI
jgi:hypothetical protein